jgi:hypothetical protein
MRPWVDRVTIPSNALQYLSEIILNMLIVMGTFGLLILVVFLYSS